MTSKLALARSLPPILASLLVFGCASGPPPASVSTDAASPALECTSPQMQRALTFCASPLASEQAVFNEDMRQALARGQAGLDLLPIPTEGSPARGPMDARVTAVVFGDLECPYSAHAHASFVELLEAYPDDLRVVFKHAPLPFHERAIPASLGALAMGEQGKFWEFVDLAYANPEDLSEDAIIGHVNALGGDLEAWNAAFGSKPHTEAMERDVALAAHAGVAGTPTIFINGIRIIGALDLEEFAAIIDEQLIAAQELTDAGVPANEVYWRLLTTQYEELLVADDDEQDEIVELTIEYVPVGEAPAQGAEGDDILVTMIVFSDFQCGFCARAAETLDGVMETYGDRVRLVYMHYPLPMHDRAGHAAAASMVAAEHGKFWAMHDQLFAHQEDLSDEALKRYALEAGLEPAVVDGLEEAMQKPENLNQIGADVERGQELGVTGTPTFFINGIMVAGALASDHFIAIIEDQLALAATVQEETQATGEELYEALVRANQERD